MNLRTIRYDRFATLLLAAAMSASLCGTDSLPWVNVAPAAELPWPQFRGPRGDGHAVARDLPLRWSESENVVWKTSLPGEGWSSPVLGTSGWWMTAADPEGRVLSAICVSPSDGKLLHHVEVFRKSKSIGKNPKNSFASPTPVIDDKHVYVHFGALGTACLNQKSGAIVWHNEELQLEHKEGPGSSPILWNDLLMLTCDGMDVQYVAALEKSTGKVRWKVNRSGKMHDNPDFRKAYCTPTIVTVDGRDQLIRPGADRVIAYEPADGRELWRVEYKGFSIVPRPVQSHGLLFVTTAFAKPELWAIRTGGSGDATATHVAWKMKKQVPSSPSSLVVGDELYLISDKGILTCVAVSTGEELWTERLGGNFSASPLLADGKVYLFSEEGLTYVLQPGKSFHVLAENHLDGRILASPAAVDRALYIRTDKAFYRIQKQ